MSLPIWILLISCLLYTSEAGHPKPFNLKYIGIGNEDMITEVFEERFAMIYKACLLYTSMEQFIKYARSKGVEVFLWYSSSGYWNDIEPVSYTHLVFHSLVSALKEWAEGPQPKYGMPFQ